MLFKITKFNFVFGPHFNHINVEFPILEIKWLNTFDIEPILDILREKTGLLLIGNQRIDWFDKKQRIEHALETIKQNPKLSESIVYDLFRSYPDHQIKISSDAGYVIVLSETGDKKLEKTLEYLEEVFNT